MWNEGIVCYFNCYTIKWIKWLIKFTDRYFDILLKEIYFTLLLLKFHRQINGMKCCKNIIKYMMKNV